MAVAGARVSQVAWSGRLRVPASRGAQLLAASGFALAQPLFSLLGKNAEFFAVRGSTPGDIVLFALVVTFVPALLLLAVEFVVGAVSASAGFVLHLRLPRFPRRGLRRAGAQALGRERHGRADRRRRPDRGRDRAGGVAAAPARSFLNVLAAAPVVFLALFLLHSPTSKLVISSGTAEAAAIRTHATTPIVFLLLDEFPVIDLQQADGGIDAKRFPNFARLARELDLVPQHHDRLGLDHGRRARDPERPEPPKQGALPIVRDHPNNLFTLLGDRYRMVVHESQTRLCPQRLCKREDGERRLTAVVALLGRARRLPASDRAAGARAAAARDRRVVGQLRRRLHRRGSAGGERLERPAEGRLQHLLPQPRP